MLHFYQSPSSPLALGRQIFQVLQDLCGFEEPVLTPLASHIYNKDPVWCLISRVHSWDE